MMDDEYARPPFYPRDDMQFAGVGGRPLQNRPKPNVVVDVNVGPGQRPILTRDGAIVTEPANTSNMQEQVFKIDMTSGRPVIVPVGKGEMYLFSLILFKTGNSVDPNPQSHPRDKVQFVGVDRQNRQDQRLYASPSPYQEEYRPQRPRNRNEEMRDNDDRNMFFDIEVGPGRRPLVTRNGQVVTGAGNAYPVGQKKSNIKRNSPNAQDQVFNIEMTPGKPIVVPEGERTIFVLFKIF